jgi:hypothetical protein
MAISRAATNFDRFSDNEDLIYPSFDHLDLVDFTFCSSFSFSFFFFSGLAFPSRLTRSRNLLVGFLPSDMVEESGVVGLDGRNCQA